MPLAQYITRSDITEPHQQNYRHFGLSGQVRHFQAILFGFLNQTPIFPVNC